MGLYLFKSFSGPKIPPILARVQNNRCALQVTLLANAVPDAPRQFGWIHNRSRNGVLAVFLPITVTAVARDRRKRRLFCRGLNCAHMANQAIGSDRAREVEDAFRLVARRGVPLPVRGVICRGGLEKMSA